MSLCLIEIKARISKRVRRRIKPTKAPCASQRWPLEQNPAPSSSFSVIGKTMTIRRKKRKERSIRIVRVNENPNLFSILSISNSWNLNLTLLLKSHFLNLT